MEIKTIFEYLKNGEFSGSIGKHEVSIKLARNCIEMCIDKEKYTIDLYNAQEEIQDILYGLDKTEVRFCDECGKPYDAGFMIGDGEWYCCEECFEKIKEEDDLRPTEEEGCNGGFYEYTHDDGTVEDTGVFWTNWND